MTDGEGYGVATFGGTLAVAIALVAGLALGVAVGAPVATGAALTGAVVVVAAAASVEREENVDRAAASLGLALAAALFAVPVAVLGDPVVAALALGAAAAVVAAGLDARTRFFAAFHHDVAAPVRRSAEAIVGAALVAGLIGLVAVVAVTSGLPALERATTASTFVALIALQVEALLVVGALRVAMPIVDDWVGDESESVHQTATRLAEATSVPTRALVRFGGLLGVQAFIAVFVPGSLDAVLSSMPVAGAEIEAVLSNRTLHVSLEALLAVLGGVVALEFLRAVVAAWAEPDPPRTVANATGGVVAFALVGAAGAVPPTAAAMQDATATGRPVLAVGFVLGALAAGLAGVFVFVVALRYAAMPPEIPDMGPGFAVAAGLLFACAIGGGLVGGFAPAVFGVAAGAFVVWDVGGNAARLGTTLGSGAETARGEFVRAGSSVVVALGVVALATAIVYVLGPLSVSIPAWRGYLALTLALVALFAFTLSLLVSSPTRT